MVFFQETVTSLGFHDLLTETLLCTLILLQLNIFHKKKNPSNTTYLECKMMILLCLGFIVSLS